MSQGMKNLISPIQVSISAQPYGWALGIFIVFRIFAFAYFNGNYIDSDQCVLAQQAEDFSRGLFHSPFFYGQGYNVSVEAVLAAPLIQLGLNPLWALPLVTAVLSALPWVLFSQIPTKPEHRAWVLWSSFLWPISYTQISLLPRGFIQGLAIAAIGLFAFEKGTRGKWYILSVSSAFAILANPNSLLLLVAVLPRAWKQRSGQPWLGLLAGLLAGIAAFKVLQSWSQTHSDLWVHGMPNLGWSTQSWLENVQSLPQRLEHLIWTPGWLALLISASLMALLLMAFRRGWIGLLLTLTLLATLGSPKLVDGTAHIFYSHGRFFLGIPLFIAFSLATGHSPALRPKLGWGVLAMAVYGFGFWHFSSIRHFGNVYCPVMVYHRATFQEHAHEILEASETADCVIIGNHWVIEAGSQGFGLAEDLPPSFRPVYERRMFELLPLLDKPTDEILLLDIEIDQRPEVKLHPDLTWNEIPSSLGTLYQIRTKREKSLREVLQILQLDSPDWAGISKP
jgi:hypothetical protein